MTRLAILADLHGNLPALEAVLQDLAQFTVDRVIVAGDVIDRGLFSVQVIDTMPLPVCTYTRSGRDRCFQPDADYRYPYSAHRAILELDFCALYAGCIQHIVQLFGSALPSGELLGDGQHRLL